MLSACVPGITSENISSALTLRLETSEIGGLLRDGVCLTGFLLSRSFFMILRRRKGVNQTGCTDPGPYKTGIRGLPDVYHAPFGASPYTRSEAWRVGNALERDFGLDWVFFYLVDCCCCKFVESLVGGCCRCKEFKST